MVGYGSFYTGARERCHDEDAVAYITGEPITCIVLGSGRRNLSFVLGPTFVGWKLFDWELRSA